MSGPEDDHHGTLLFGHMKVDSVLPADPGAPFTAPSQDNPNGVSRFETSDATFGLVAVEEDDEVGRSKAEHGGAAVPSRARKEWPGAERWCVR